MLGLLLLIGGITILVKGELKITAKRKLSGKVAKALGALFLITALVGMALGASDIPGVGIVSLMLYGLVILIAIFLVIFVKGERIEKVPAEANKIKQGFCHQCGTPRKDTAYCTNCGAKLDSQNAA